MKIRELLEMGEDMQNEPTGGSAGMGMGAPMASINPMATTGTSGTSAPTPTAMGAQAAGVGPGPMTPTPGAAAAPMKTAGLWDMAKDFMSTPQPVGNGQPAQPLGGTPNPGQPPQSNFISRALGTDTINKALTGQQPK